MDFGNDNGPFSRPEDGSRDRYIERRSSVPWATHTLWWVIHNAIAHPLIAVLPIGPAFTFHDWTSHKMHGKDPMAKGHTR